MVELDKSTVWRKLKRLYSDRITIFKNGIKIKEILDLSESKRSEIEVKVLGEERGYHGIKKFEGVNLKDLIKELNPHRDFNKAIIVYGIDGYRSVFSVGEIFLSKEKILLADKVNQSSIEKGGKFILIPSGDIFADRMIKAVSEIRLISLP